MTLVGVKISLGAWPWEKEKLARKREKEGVEMGRWMRRAWVEEVRAEVRSEATIRCLGRRASVGGLSPAVGAAGLAGTTTEVPQGGARRASGMEIGVVGTLRARNSEMGE